MKILQEVTLNDAFNTQMKKVQDAIGRLNDIVGKMQEANSVSKLTNTQKMQLRYVIEDLEKLLEKAQ